MRAGGRVTQFGWPFARPAGLVSRSVADPRILCISTLRSQVGHPAEWHLSGCYLARHVRYPFSRFSQRELP